MTRAASSKPARRGEPERELQPAASLAAAAAARR
jgi:hypothetical protein